MVAMAPRPSGGRQALPRRKARPAPAETTRQGAARAQPEPATTAMPPLPTMPSRLTDTQWACIEALLPRNGGRGRPWREHRAVIDGMLWVHASGASWRDLPEEEFGPWQTIYYRYNRWRKEVLWQHIREALRCQR
jgi:hypothetical protein